MIDVALARAEAPEIPGDTAPESVALAFQRLREESRRWAKRERACLTSGVGALDKLLAGGWPLGAVAELVGVASRGRTAVATATVAAAVARGEVAAWVDAADAFDPTSMAAAGVALDRVLWVRPRDVETAVRAAELTLEAGGFTVAVVDLGQGTASGGRLGLTRYRGALVLRLVRAAERARAVVLTLAERPWVGAHAAVSLHLGRAAPGWRGGAVRWLDGLGLTIEPVPGVDRGDRARGPARDALPFGVRHPAPGVRKRVSGP